MRKTIVKLLTASLVSFLALNTAQADTGNITCPDPAAIQAVGLEKVVNSNDNEWGAYIAKNNFGTDKEWTFTLGMVIAKNEAAARKRLETLLATLTQYTPPERDGKQVYCLYVTAERSKPIFGITVTPPLNIPSAMDQLRKHVG